MKTDTLALPAPAPYAVPLTNAPISAVQGTGVSTAGMSTAGMSAAGTFSGAHRPAVLGDDTGPPPRGTQV